MFNIMSSQLRLYKAKWFGYPDLAAAEKQLWGEKFSKSIQSGNMLLKMCFLFEKWNPKLSEDFLINAEKLRNVQTLLEYLQH